MNAKLTDEEWEAEKRFQDILGRLVNTPHKPHVPLKPKPDTKSPQR